MAVKTSILLLYIRMSRNTRLFLRWASYVTLVIVIVAGTAVTFLTIFRCRPIQAAYLLNVQGAHCISIETIYLTSAPVNVATDLAILVLPIPVITAISIPRKQKIVLVLTFLLGGFRHFHRCRPNLLPSASGNRGRRITCQSTIYLQC